MISIEDKKMNDNLEKYIQKRGDDPKRIEKYIHFYQLAKDNGVVPFRYARIAEEYTDDYFAETGVPQSEKEWYYERGIPTFKTGWYGLTKENYNDYISDFDFYSPKNYLRPQLIKWFDYKLTTYYVLNAFREYMPRHYFFIENGILFPVDMDIKRHGTVEDVLELLETKSIALKSCSGGHGKGFYKIELIENEYKINNSIAQERDVVDLISSLDDYILTEYCIPHKMFREACGEDRFAVLRTVSVFDKNDGPQITAIMIRLGTSISGLVSDYDGSIYCGIDMQNGNLFDPIMRTGDEEGIIRKIPSKYHPDTGADLESLHILLFEQLKSLVKNVSAFLSMTPYLVMDIIPTDNGFKILEINSHGQIRIAEPFFPFRKNKYNLSVFETRDW